MFLISAQIVVYKRSNVEFVSHLSSLCHYYAPQLYRQVLLRRVLAMGILSVCLSVCHDPVVYQAQMR